MLPIEQRRRRSARETFSQCRFRYAKTYVEGVDGSSGATRRGSCFHAAMARYCQSLFNAHLTDDAELAQEALTFARVNTPGLEHAEWLDVEFLWSRFAPDFRLDLDRFVSVEGAQACFDTVLAFDRVEMLDADTLLIVDAKTHFRIPPQAVAEDSFQVAFYLAAARKLMPGWQRYAFRFDYVRYGASSDLIVKTAAELDVIEQAIAESDEAMAQAEDLGIFPATGGHHCPTCPVAHLCPLTINPFRPAGTAQEAIGRIAAHEAARTLLIEALRGHVDANGPQTAGGMTWDHRPRLKVGYPADLVVDVLREVGIPVPAHLKLSASSVSTLTESKRKYLAVAEQIKALAVVRSAGTVFSGKAVAGEDDADAHVEAE